MTQVVRYAPPSFDKAVFSEWATDEARPKKIYRKYVKRYADLYQEWFAAREGMLNPDQRADQEAAATRYVTDLVEAHEGEELKPKGGLSVLFLQFVLPMLLRALAEVLFNSLFGFENDGQQVQGCLPEWRAYVASGGTQHVHEPR